MLRTALCSPTATGVALSLKTVQVNGRGYKSGRRYKGKEQKANIEEQKSHTTTAQPRNTNSYQKLPALPFLNV